MNSILNQLSNLDRKYKLLLVISNDFFFALVWWLVFGPPMATYIASEFSTGIFEIFQREWKSFVFPASLSILYLYIFGFYKSLIKFFDSKDSIFLSLSGALIFGFSWSIIPVIARFLSMLLGILNTKKTFHPVILFIIHFFRSICTKGSYASTRANHHYWSICTFRKG